MNLSRRGLVRLLAFAPLAPVAGLIGQRVAPVARAVAKPLPPGFNPAAFLPRAVVAGPVLRMSSNLDTGMARVGDTIRVIANGRLI